MRRLAWVCLLCLAACASGGSPLTMNAFYEIPVGASQEEVVKAAGKPYAIHKKEDGSVEYEYIERFKIGDRDVNERHYYLVMKEGRVVSKRVQQQAVNPYGYDSYEMQTTQHNEDGHSP